MKFISSCWQLLVAAFTYFHQTTIAPENGKEPLPPIRYDDDPRDIYLA